MTHSPVRSNAFSALTRSLALLTVAIVATLSSAGAHAQVVAAVNLQMLINDAAPAATLRTELTSLQEEINAALATRQTELQVMQQSLEEMNQGTPEYQAKQDELILAGLQFEADRNFQQRRLQRAEMQGIVDLIKSIRTAIGVVAREEGIDIVVQYNPREEFSGQNAQQLQAEIGQRIVLYVSEQADVTDLVLRQLELVGR